MQSYTCRLVLVAETAREKRWVGGCVMGGIEGVGSGSPHNWFKNQLLRLH